MLSHYWVAAGDLEKSLAASLHALELDPLDLVLISHLGWHYLHTGQYELGVEACQRAIDMDAAFFARGFHSNRQFSFFLHTST